MYISLDIPTFQSQRAGAVIEGDFCKLYTIHYWTSPNGTRFTKTRSTFACLAL